MATGVQISQFQLKSRSDYSKIVSKYDLQMVRDVELIFMFQKNSTFWRKKSYFREKDLFSIHQRQSGPL